MFSSMPEDGADPAFRMRAPITPGQGQVKGGKQRYLKWLLFAMHLCPNRMAAFAPLPICAKCRRIMPIEIAIEDWPTPSGQWDSWPALANRVMAAVQQVAPELANPRLEVSLLLTTDAEIRALNREWRGRDKPTNVLSFPMLARAELLALAPHGPPVMLGDIALSCETCMREAADKSLPLEHHAAHLVVHGLLHLAGHDHEISPQDAATMETLEVLALAQLGIGDPYSAQ